MNRKNTIYYKVADYICSRYGQQDDTKYVAMFLDMMTFQIFETVLILGIAIVMGITIETVLVMIFFIMARVGHKGVHARNRTQCVFLSLILIVGIAYVSSLIGLLSSIIFGYIAGIALRKRK